LALRLHTAAALTSSQFAGSPLIDASPNPGDTRTRCYDYVIVGAGTAGCVLASRLSEDPDVRILLLEAGNWDTDPWLHIPAAWPRVLQQRRSHWRYEADVGPVRQTFDCTGGQVVGGSSSVNALTFVRGHRSDYDRWSAMGLSGLAFERVLPYFRKLETWEGGPDEYRGGRGPIFVSLSRFPDPIANATLEAASIAGYGLTDDYNGVHQDGFSLSQQTVAGGARVSTATAYLEPAKRRGGLEIVTRARALQIVFEGVAARGIRYVSSGSEQLVRASREVILCGGAFQSPHLLLLSGVGNPRELQRCGIGVVAPLGGVGQNLRNHVSFGIAFARRRPGLLRRGLRLDRAVAGYLQARWLRKGFLTMPPNCVTGFVRSSLAREAPDLQIQFMAAPDHALPYLPLSAGYEDGFSLRAVLLRPESSGAVTLANSDPAVGPLIRHRILSATADRARLAEAVGIIREIASRSPLAGFSNGEQGGPPPAASPEALIDYVLRTASPMYHQAGTCRMGLPGDFDAVVDQDFRVHGTEGLRVVDASVMPGMVGGNTFACVTMLAELASDVILGGGPSK
jgi:4-pyridoxate dehydrogenase